MRLRPNSAFLPAGAGRRSGYTLVEILVATTLTLILMTAVVAVFGGVGGGIAKSRRVMEQFDRLRTAAQQLRLDLQGVTVTLDGRPTRPEENKGYFEYIEGGILSMPQGTNLGTPQAINDVGGGTDSSVGERGDILMFTTRNAARPFLGRYALSVDSSNPTLQSDVAEVAWFLRGTTLHRRVLLVAPGTASALNQNYGTAHGQQQLPLFYAYNDISVRLGSANGNRIPVPNSLGDLTKRENRFAHPADKFPFDVRRWGLLGLPTLAECSSPTWMATNSWVSGSTPIPQSSLPSISQKIDYWDNGSIANAFFPNTSGTPSPDQYLALEVSGTCTRLADDVILTNVIGFDVKVWDPGAPVRTFPDPNTGQPVIVKPGDPGYPKALTNSSQKIVSYGAYVDPGWSIYDPNYPNKNNPPNDPQIPPAPTPHFWDLGNAKSMLDAHFPGDPVGNLTSPTYPFGNPSIPRYPTYPQRVYDSGCFSYENEGIYCYFVSPATGNLTVGSLGPNPQLNSLLTPASQYPKPYYPNALGQWPAGTSTNGLDDNHDGVVDDVNEQITSSPYPVPLRGIQVKIRCYEPDSRLIREITIEQDFLPK